jgi:hypothetical protein
VKGMGLVVAVVLMMVVVVWYACLRETRRSARLRERMLVMVRLEERRMKIEGATVLESPHMRCRRQVWHTHTQSRQMSCPR